MIRCLSATARGLPSIGSGISVCHVCPYSRSGVSVGGVSATVRSLSHTTKRLLPGYFARMKNRSACPSISTHSLSPSALPYPLSRHCNFLPLTSKSCISYNPSTLSRASPQTTPVCSTISLASPADLACPLGLAPKSFWQISSPSARTTLLSNCYKFHFCPVLFDTFTFAPSSIIKVRNFSFSPLIAPHC